MFIILAKKGITMHYIKKFKEGKLMAKLKTNKAAKKDIH